jgi:hypothetical protein
MRRWSGCALDRNTALPYSGAVHTVIETAAYLRAARGAGMSLEEQVAVVDAIAANPLAGTPIAGGARKLRFAGRGKGKSGGYRVVTWFGGGDIPVFLLTVFGKGEKANLTKAEQNVLAGLTNRLRTTLKAEGDMS